MKVVRNVTDFYLNNDRDVSNFINKFYSTVLKYYDIEDIKAEIYERLYKKHYVENYAPLYIGVDPEDGFWEVKRAKAKFSTYIYTFVRNYVCSYYNKIKPDELHTSLDAYNDSGYDETSHNKIKMLESVLDHFTPTIGSDLKIELLNKLEKLKGNNKGTLVLDKGIDINVAKLLDSLGGKGCDKDSLIKVMSNDHADTSDLSGMEKYFIDQRLESIEKKGIIRSDIVKDDEGNIVTDDEGREEKVFFLDDPERRSLYNLLRYYLQGFRDKEISEKFKMTVAGVGAMKRTLRKELRSIA